ncbi:uncharacterized protein L201_001004 [Kwoniella dendrophila CBS 6074]|uniref:Peptidase A1 domain-containing protein n=1 Tax=Kwoniella dendrophila CBS 6074 TaxID=1295534 RepID=A0AAX4JMJ7_9TREE
MTTFHILALFSILHLLVLGAPYQPDPLHKLPLKKIRNARNGEHPILTFERHQKAGIKRMHKYKRSTPPSEEEFEKLSLERRNYIENSNLDKRLWIPEHRLPALPFKHEEKRLWWRPTDIAAAPASTKATVVPHVAAVANDNTSSADAAQDAPAAATATVKASGSNGNGFSEAAIQAMNDNTLTHSTSALIQGGLDYIIEANDIGYLCEIQIGTPAQTFLLLMDTGSADTWVPSTECGVHCGGHTALGANNSQTYQASDKPFRVAYGSGDVAGVLGSDTMTIAGMTMTNHSLGVATQESAQFSRQDIPFDGLVGLALSKISDQGVPTPIEALASNGLIKEPILGVALGRLTDGENNGELVFGQADTSKYDPATTQTLKISSDEGFWQIEMAGVTIDGVQVLNGRQAILDTGTSLMIAPPADAAAFHAQIKGSKDAGGGMYSIPCTISQEISMTFGNIAFQIDVRDLLFQPMTEDLNGDCLSSLSAGNIKDDVTWLLGDSFLKNVYMTTNANDLTVQLSARTDSKGASVSSGSNQSSSSGTPATTVVGTTEDVSTNTPAATTTDGTTETIASSPTETSPTPDPTESAVSNQSTETTHTENTNTTMKNYEETDSSTYSYSHEVNSTPTDTTTNSIFEALAALFSGRNGNL